MTGPSAERSAIGFIGLGAMGAPIARCLLAAGHDSSSTASRAQAAVRADAGARFVDTPAQAALARRTILLSLPGPGEAETVVGEVMEAARAEDVVVDLSTNAHANVVSPAERLATMGIIFVDAPLNPKP